MSIYLFIYLFILQQKRGTNLRFLGEEARELIN